jgi:cysteine desulfurase
LIVALGAAAEIALHDHRQRQERCKAIRREAIKAFESLNPRYSGDQSRVMPHVLNMAFEGLDSEALIVALKDLVAISNGSACTSTSYTPSHVLKAMGMTDDESNACVRISWCHQTPEVNWNALAARIASLR